MTTYKAQLCDAILKLCARVEALEGKYETQRLATLEWGKDVDTQSRLIDRLWTRVEQLEANSKPTPNPGQIGSSLVERVQDAIHDVEFPHGDDEARAAIREVALWLNEAPLDLYTADRAIVVNALYDQANQ